jgi:hypothetical protein
MHAEMLQPPRDGSTYVDDLLIMPQRVCRSMCHSCRKTISKSGTIISKGKPKSHF